MDTRNSEKIFSYLEKIHTRFELISAELSVSETVHQQKKFRELSKELFLLRPLAGKYHQLKKLLRRLHEAESMLTAAEEKEMTDLVQEELTILNQEKEILIGEVEILMVSDRGEDNRNAFLEIRAGAGGDEASLFAADLLRMYTRVAERKKWQAEIISTTISGIGGIKEVILYVKGTEVNKFLKFESGVHRVQRVPATEASGRIHTSTVTVAVLPEVEDVEVDFNPKDIRIDTYAASGPGGQHVNKTESAIRVTHFPTGIVVTCQDEKSQHKNKEKALKVLKARLFEHEKNKQNESIASSRKSQVGSGERSEKIRTYNFPQSRVTDHRVNGRNFNIGLIIDGDLDDLVAELSESHVRALIEQKIKSILA
ncbi:MAG: peptide chain release factor 1 [Acidobacteria bacterium]|nr:peptide chain release factor 1 [Acidobacteriota bacterium]MBU4306787.1 peptide chain release factor 1 [Acidobacteriota bacterium]MBU4405840.1 peptide chain release factor 1 [Acidobacteriota bacterium]